MSERQAPPPPIDQPPPSRRRRGVIIVAIALLIPIVSIVVCTGIFLQTRSWQSFHVGSGAMIPNLVVGDFFFVDRKAYLDGRSPQRGDIVLHYPPAHMFGGRPQAGRPAPFIKRVIGLPGDRVQLINGVPVLNGTPVVQEHLGSYSDATQPRSRGRLVRELLPGGASYQILKISQNGPADNGPIFIVPAGAYFVVGDNRDDSLDSRMASGPGQPLGWYVPLADITGRANYVYWSGFDRLGRIGMALK